MNGVRHPAPLSWEEFSRDLRFAAHHCGDIHIFSLEGCVHQGFLERLSGFNWGLPVKAPQPWTGILHLLRAAFRASLWLASRPILLIGILVCMFGLLAL
jgi:hypothetical protein